MIQRHCLLLLAGALAWAALAGPAAAQDGPEEQKRRLSHLPIDSVGDPGLRQLILEQKLRHARDLGEIQGLLESPAIREMARDIVLNPGKYGLGAKQVEEIRRQIRQGGEFKPDPNDPAWKDVIDKVMQHAQANAPGMTITPDQKEAMERLFGGSAQQSNPAFGPSHHPLSPENGSSPSNQGSPSPPSPPPGAPPQPGGQAASPDGMPPEQDPGLETRARFTRELYNLAERLQKVDPELRKSPALRDFMKSLARHAAARNPSSSGLPDPAKRLGEHLPHLRDYLNIDELRRTAEQWRPHRPVLPAAPHLHLPHGGPVSFSADGLPHPGGGAGGRAGWQLLVWALVVAGFGLVLWRILARHRERVLRIREAGWRIGPWPVNPAEVATREDLVRAFDYLALLCLGPAARSWNHLEIAARLGEEGAAAGRRGAANGERRGAAADLALLYEQARYAPPTEALPEADLASARRDLCLLAGVPAA